MKYLIVNKPVGVTPLQCIENAKALGFFRDTTVSYAGRLDPMASGLLVLVNGKDTQLRHEMMAQDKVYAVTAVFGVSSDSLDVLGKLQRGSMMSYTHQQLESKLDGMVGSATYPIPEYSSVPVLGKPSFLRAQTSKEKTLGLHKEMKISAAKLLRLYKVRVEDIISQLVRSKRTLNGDFRFDTAISDWKEVNEESAHLIAADIVFDVSSGTYIRSLVDYLGKASGASGLAFSIKRIKLGQWHLRDESFIQHVG